MIFQTFKMNIYRIKDEHSFKKVLITYIIKLSHKMHGQQFMSFQFETVKNVYVLLKRQNQIV